MKRPEGLTDERWLALQNILWILDQYEECEQVRRELSKLFKDFIPGSAAVNPVNTQNNGLDV